MSRHEEPGGHTFPRHRGRARPAEKASCRQLDGRARPFPQRGLVPGLHYLVPKHLYPDRSRASGATYARGSSSFVSSSRPLSASAVPNAVGEFRSPLLPRRVATLTLTSPGQLLAADLDFVGGSIADAGGGVLACRCEHMGRGWNAVGEPDDGRPHFHGYVTAEHAELALRLWVRRVAGSLCGQHSGPFEGRGLPGWMKYVEAQREAEWRAYGCFTDVVDFAERRCSICGRSLLGRRPHAQTCSATCRKRLKRRRDRRKS